MTTQQMKEEKQDKILVNLTASLEKLGQSVDKLYQFVDKLDQRLDQKITEEREKWEENKRSWEENQKQTTALTSAIQSLEQRFNQMLAEDRKKWAENERRWAENEASQKKNDQRLMAIGARWGTDSEASFRNALAGILKESPGVEVINADVHDDEGIVFGFPETVELDVIIKNEMLMICELKSFVHKSDIYTFERKIRFYEQKKGREATRKIVISPMVDKRALPVAKKLSMEVYSFADDVIL
ncbi:MAG: DUF3782 domain-containing protein [Thiomargarita sp.]|nr:DUF3782 domain-containing protein [Thiomargarita sp.]